MLTFFYFKNSCSLASHIALEQSGADYKAVSVDLMAGEQRAEDYLAMNAKGRVPLLVTEQGTVTENPAILTYIAQQFPAAKLAPIDDPFKLAQVQSFNAYLSSTVHVAHAHGVRGIRWSDDDAAIASMKDKMPGNVADCFELIESTLFAGPWVMGQDYSICDSYLFTLAQWMEMDRVDPARFPMIAEHRARMRELPAVKRVLAAQ